MSSGTAPGGRGGNYVQSGEVRTYYEVHGDGDPLVLLHGGLCTLETFDGLTPLLAERFRVYTPERRGHGRTADVDGPITYVNMAQDTIEFMDALGIVGAHLVGFSDGAAIAVHVVLDRPDLVARLVLIGQALNQDDGAVPPAVIASLDDLAANLPLMLAQLYGAVSPDGPEHFGVIVDKLAPLWRSEPTFTFDQLATIAAPTLFLMGDSDWVTLQHADAVRHAIPAAQLAVVPGATHALPMEKPEMTARLTLDFLDAY
jgi:pimeloyl-ACP methyl ester carboxylesterase